MPFQGPVLPYFGIAQDAEKWEWLGFEAVSPPPLPLPLTPNSYRDGPAPAARIRGLPLLVRN